MSVDRYRHGHSRRSFLRALTAGGTLAIAGCQSGDQRSAERVTPAPVPALDRTTVPLATSTLEVRHGDLDGPDAAAMGDLLATFDDAHRPVSVVDRRLPGGLDDQVRKVEDRVVVGYGPIGAALRPLASSLLDLSTVWNDQGFNAGAGPANTCMIDYRLVAIPQSLHRLNCLYYDPVRLDDAGLEPTDFATLPAFLSALAEATDVPIPFARPLRDARERLALWEILLVGHVDRRASYLQLVSGTVDDHRDDVRAATADFAGLWSGLTPSVRRSDPATLLDGVVEERIGCVALPSWAARHLLARPDSSYGVDWAVSAVPGTAKRFPFTGDGFVAFSASDHREVATRFLTEATSVRAQQRFTQRSGSVLPRIAFDAGGDPHPFYHDQWNDYRRSWMQPPSIAYGQAVSPDVRRAIEAALSTMDNHWDVDRTTDEILAALERATVL